MTLIFRYENEQNDRGTKLYECSIERATFKNSAGKERMLNTEVNKANDFVEARVGVRYCDRYRSCDRV